MVERAAGVGAEVVTLKTNRISGSEFAAEDARRSYAKAKTTLVVTVASPSKRRPRPIPPSADWQFHLAEGCPAHCQYCYLAGSLTGPPTTRAYANLPEILADLHSSVGQGTVTSRSTARRDEGTTFEASCYTDPLGIEHITGSLAETIRHFGSWDAAVQLRWTTKFDAVESLLSLPHSGRTRVRFSVNAQEIARKWEGGTANIAARLQAMRRMAQAGYPVGLTVAPIMPVPGWQSQYDQLFRDTAAALAGISDLDLTAELITHRFTPVSKQILQSWYPITTLEMEEGKRTRKITKFGSEKYVFPKETMRELREGLERAIGFHLPMARILYWT